LGCGSKGRNGEMAKSDLSTNIVEAVDYIIYILVIYALSAHFDIILGIQ
jgi:hypothetical protein